MLRRPDVFKKKLLVPVLKCVKHFNAVILTIHDNHFLVFHMKLKSK